MSWWSVVPLLAVAVMLFILPGGIVAWCSGVRGFTLWAIAPVVSVAVISVSAVLASFVGLRWSFIPVAGLTVVVAVVAFVIARLIKRGKSRAADEPPIQLKNWSYRIPLLELAVMLLAAALIGRRVVFAFGTPDSFSQLFDVVFHLNAIRYIQDTGSASSLTLGSMTGGTITGLDVYPAAWHDVVSLLTSITGAGIPVAVNLVNLVIAAVVWPLGTIFLVQQIFGRRPAVTVVAGILSAAFGAFPLLMLAHGVVYPYYLGLSLLPSLLGLSLQVLGLAKEKVLPPLIACLLILVGLAGLGLAHTSLVVLFFGLLTPPMLFVWVSSLRRRWRVRRSLWHPLVSHLLLLILGLGVLLVLWKSLRPPADQAFWPPIESAGQAVGEFLTSAPLGAPASWAIALLVVVGLWALIFKWRKIWLVGMFGLIAILFVVATSQPIGALRMFMTGVWYNDPPRLAAQLPLVLLPVAAAGALYLFEVLRSWASSKLANRQSTGKPRDFVSLLGKYATPAIAVVAIAVLVVVTQQANIRAAAIVASRTYQLKPDSWLVNTDEMKLIQRLDKDVPAGDLMVGNPWNGSALAYAFSDRKTLQLHMLSAISPDLQKVITHLHDAKKDPSVCEAVRRLNVSFVLDFGTQEVPGRTQDYSGLSGLLQAGVATLVDQQGEAAKLYRITACGM
ncbi:DUF6541 family protein [Psychromicrobium sp. YIM B11713]|uniref:DUF6541 family protein n=1 Tax=Psychromicrobium sp. YIM B11713 TaxID=3145233 RepID=UPI00374EF555